MTLREEIVNLTEDRKMNEEELRKGWEDFKALFSKLGNLSLEEFFSKNAWYKGDEYYHIERGHDDAAYCWEKPQVCWITINRLFNVIRTYEDVSFGIKGTPNEILNKIKKVASSFDEFKRFCVEQQREARKYYNKHAL